MSDLATELANASYAAIPKLKAQYEEAVALLERAGGEAAEIAKSSAKRIAEYTRDGMTGKVSRAVAERGVANELRAIDNAWGGLKEATGHEGIAKAKAVLEIAGQVAIALLKVGAAAL